MTNIDDFIQWWEGFRDAIDPANITQEHLDIISRKIEGLVDLWDISLPSWEEKEIPPEYNPPSIFPNYLPYWIPQDNPKNWPRVPDIWCKGPFHVGTPIKPVVVGDPALYN